MQGRVSFTFPFTSAVTSTDTLKQVSTVILLAPSVSNSVGSLGVMVIAPVCIRNMTVSYSCTGWLYRAIYSTEPPTPSNELIV